MCYNISVISSAASSAARGRAANTRKGKGWKKKSRINKERQRERGGRDGNGKKHEVSPMGEACMDSLNPSNLLLICFLHHSSFQGETRKGENEKEEPS